MLSNLLLDRLYGNKVKAAEIYGFLNHHLHLRLSDVLIEPDIVLFVLLPILIFDASRKIPIRDLNH